MHASEDTKYNTYISNLGLTLPLSSFRCHFNVSYALDMLSKTRGGLLEETVGGSLHAVAT